MREQICSVAMIDGTTYVRNSAPPAGGAEFRIQAIFFDHGEESRTEEVENLEYYYNVPDTLNVQQTIPSPAPAAAQAIEAEDEDDEPEPSKRTVVTRTSNVFYKPARYRVVITRVVQSTSGRLVPEPEHGEPSLPPTVRKIVDLDPAKVEVGGVVWEAVPSSVELMLRRRIAALKAADEVEQLEEEEESEGANEEGPEAAASDGAGGNAQPADPA